METTKNEGLSNWLKTSVTTRMLMIGFIILILLVPLVFIKNLITERYQRQQEVVAEVSQLWGQEVLLMGPILKIPYKVYSESTKMVKGSKKVITERTSNIEYAFFFPDDLKINAQVDALKKERGIYEASVFTGTIDLSGVFGTPNFQTKDIAPEDILWDSATFILRTSNLKGIKNQLEMTLGTDTMKFLPKHKRYYANTSLSDDKIVINELESTYLKQGKLLKKGQLMFSTQVKVNGSNRLRFVPIGKRTLAHVHSNWKDPSFIGNFLPEEDGQKQVDASGFSANWKVLQTNRQFGQSFFENLPDLGKFSFGTEFLVPVDEYQKSERSVKYGYLVIALTFLVFFLIQTINKIPIHAFQYLMIGLALVLFYTLLISISEHRDFLTAYGLAGTAVVGLITIYSRSILTSHKFVGLIFGSLSALYLFIFFIIQLEHYALLVGSIGLFSILAMVMLASRKINWHMVN